MRAYLFDLDGTLADCEHRRHHVTNGSKNWAAFFAACIEDAPIPHIVTLAQHLSEADVVIVYVSGRSDECRPATEDWLHRHELPAGPLYMRKKGDHRPDDTIKGELIEQIKADGYEPIMAFDDRNRVVKKLRHIGIPCAQVAEGDF
jgi:phosphoglycolate phosphatase-like HAD superfamily hydrolase